MGDAADDVWESAFNRQMDFELMVSAIRENCEHGKRCEIVYDDTGWQDDDWLPYRCRQCGERFDYP